MQIITAERGYQFNGAETPAIDALPGVKRPTLVACDLRIRFARMASACESKA